MQGALVVESARLRQAEQVHVAALTRQAFHDALTGLLNRSYLLDRAEQAVDIAGATGTRAALLLHAQDVESLIRGADALMYQAKRAGGGVRVAH